MTTSWFAWTKSCISSGKATYYIRPYSISWRVEVAARQYPVTLLMEMLAHSHLCALPYWFIYKDRKRQIPFPIVSSHTQSMTLSFASHKSGSISQVPIPIPLPKLLGILCHSLLASLNTWLASLQGTLETRQGEFSKLMNFWAIQNNLPLTVGRAKRSKPGIYKEMYFNFRTRKIIKVIH